LLGLFVKILGINKDKVHATNFKIVKCAKNSYNLRLY
jgi:hypothetical protein